MGSARASERHRSNVDFQRGLQMLAAVLAVLILMVWEHVAALQLERQLKALHKEEDRLVYLNAQMQMQVNQWESPSHLEVLAKQSLGMGPLDPKHVIGVEMP